VSGFDFGALRDPDAPQPDSHHRDGVEARAHELRSKARRNRTIVSALALAVVAAAVTGIVATRPDKHQVIVTDPSSTTTAPTTHPTIDGRFIPPTTTENGITTLPVTLPDGETFTMEYPEQMEIAQLGLGGSTVSVNWEAQTTIPFLCCSREVSISYQTIEHAFGDAIPVHVYRGPNGEAVPYFHAIQSRTHNRTLNKYDILVFQFGPWLVQVYDQTAFTHAQGGKDATEARMTEAQRETWARSLTGTVDDNGYLLLHAAEPLSIGNMFQGAFGTGDPGPNHLWLRSHLECPKKDSDTSVRQRFDNEDGPGVAWCAGALYLSAMGTKSFVDLAATQLQVSPLGTPTTPLASNALAMSATFISPQHGWVLQRGSQVSETTDGGLSWKTVASVGTVVPEDYVVAQIRFADAKRGFVRTDSNLFTTDDGGASWQHLAAPFGRVTELAISRGVVYVVAYDEKANDFTLWSSPTDRLVWTKDRLALPVGAGPVPVQQLVFSGGNGWVTNGDRGLMGGARLSASGHWETWKPPCLGDDASLAASTGADLVASCQAGVWTGPKITNWVYFSHDGGKTFQRRSAPAFGEVASPNPATAVVYANGVLRRTTDEGASWSEVAREPGTHQTLDLGFTTPTQGFVIFSDGKMMMTYDAGATWSAVTLP
jgi:photosystem II stability/assembly factor-like uncharacterized protein